MVPIDKVKDIVTKHDNLEKELSSGSIEPKLFAKKSKEYSNLGNIIEIAKEFINFENVVIEVGPGNGALTSKIFEQKPKKITVIEKDERLFKILNKKFGRLINTINDDMMKISYEEYFEENLIIFGNLPYNISTQILAKWIKTNSLEKFCKNIRIEVI